MPTLCRACCRISPVQTGQCPACASTRCLHHSDIDSLSLAHIDCDAFFAAVEKRDDPSLKTRPVIIGSGQRGVVATCCYIARVSGVRSAMPMFKALKACPDAVVVKPNFEKYSAAARQIRTKFDALTPAVEVVSIDEAYLDLSGTQAVHGAPPVVMLARLALEIERDVGITVSIGLSSNKFLAKTASELDKPRGFAVISPEDAPSLLAPRPPAALHGVGPKLAAKLTREGYETVADIQNAGQKTLIRAYGETGQYLFQRAFGLDNRKVVSGGKRKSVSSETTFNTDIGHGEGLTDQLWQVCETTAARAKAAGVEGAVVTLKLKTASFKSLTRRTSLSDATQLARAMFDAAKPLLDREVGSGDVYRLIGVGLTNLSAARGDAVDLVDPGIAKRAAAERATDLARAKFGKDAVQSARAIRLNQRRNNERNSGGRKAPD
ncbi:MAG: DNA polymerase IV [Pseudomonadota bacterium]